MGRRRVELIVNRIYGRQPTLGQDTKRIKFLYKNCEIPQILLKNWVNQRVQLSYRDNYDK